LKPGGLWVNIGPLLYHYSEQPDEVQIEYSWEELEHIIPQLGFEFRKKEFKTCSYTARPDGLL
jgi:carnosine N-methyltransferase